MPTLNDGFDQPKFVTDVEMVFGGKMDVLLPPWDSIPKDFRNMNDKTDWNKFVNKWFFGGARLSSLKPNSLVDPLAAIRHVRAIMVSFDPKHEHKTAGVAWLLSRWFDSVDLENK